MNSPNTLKKTKTFKHSGNLGDIIYSLPTIIALGGAGLLYVGNEVSRLSKDKSFLKPYPMSDKMVSQIIELLKLQPYIDDVRRYNNEIVNYDLDKFREQDVMFEHLAVCHLKAFGVKFNLANSWLENIEPFYVKDIIINHSGRYIATLKRLDWNILKNYEEQCAFVGFEEEYKNFVEITGLNIIRYSVQSIIEFAKIIKGSKVYIGNQSLGFALAEAMKHPRILEVGYLPNCMPLSLNGYLELNKKRLDYLVRKKNEEMTSINIEFNRTFTDIRDTLFHIQKGNYKIVLKKCFPTLLMLKRFIASKQSRWKCSQCL